MLLNCGVGEDSWEPLGQQGDPTSPFSRKSTLKTDAELEAPILWPPDVKSRLIGKDSDAGKDWGQKEKGMTGDEMAGWHHWLNGCEFEWALGVGVGQEGLVCSIHGVTKSWARLRDWTELKCLSTSTHYGPWVWVTNRQIMLFILSHKCLLSS